MFAESESEELLNLLSQVRMVADEEARTDEVQQQQQQQQQQHDLHFQDNSCGAKSFPSPVSMPSAAATTATTTTTLNSVSQALTSTSAVGRYTASSTSAVDWTVRDNSNSHVGIGIGGGGARVEEQTSPFEAQSPDGRTPATGVKVLHRTTAAQRADGHDNSVEFFDADMIDVHHQPKQLFFMDAHKRAALQPQQQASPGSPLRLHTSSSLYPSGHAVAGSITASVVPRSTTPFSPTASVQRVHSGGGTIHGLGSTAISAANSSPRPFTAPVGAEFSSTVLAGYRHAGNGEKGAEANAWQMDHLSRLAADLNRASGDVGDDGGGRDRYQDGRQMPAYGQREHGTRAASDAWTPATCTGTPLSVRASNMQSPLTQAQQHAQQTLRYPPLQQQATPAKSQMYAVSSASSSPLCTGAATEGRMPTYTDSMAARVARNTTVGGSSSVTTPLSMGAVSAHRPQQQQQQQQQRGNVPQPLSAAEAAVANFFGGNSAAAETGGGASNSNNCGASQCGRRSGASGNEAAWRLNVEAELRELQRGGLGGDAARSGVSPLFSTTPTTVVSPLPPTSTTPYHQLLSQLRHSPQQGTTGHAARANTPPERRGFHAASTSAPQMRRTASEVSPMSCGDGADGGGGVGNGSRHATKFTRAGLFPTPTEASGPTILQSNTTSCHGSGGFRAPSQNWPHSSPSPAEAAALWERLSPYEKAAAAAAAAPPSGSAAALFHTPDTVAKPVVLSSIAAHLQGEGMGSTDDERSFNPHLSLTQQQQQQQRYPTPPSFTTAAVATPSTLQHAHRTGSGTRMGDIGFTSAASVSLFPTPQSASAAPLPSPQQQQHGWVRQQQQQQQQHGQSPAYMQTAAPRSATSSSAQSRLTRPPQQQFQVPLPFMRDSPVEASNNTNNNNNNSPPSCSLRPSPQMRASDGSSPALRRYVITTPNARASVAGQHVTSAGTQQYGAGSAGRQSGGGGGGGGSPMNPYGVGNDAPGGAGGRDARPRVQLSHMAATTAAALRSPLNAAAVPSVTNPAAAYNRPHTTPSYYASQGQSNAAGAAATSSVSPAAVCALIERIQAIAPTVLSGAAEFEGVSSLAPLNGSHASNTNSNNSGSASVVPEVASASVIVAMSHDQHGCRLLQAVLDAECDGEDPDSEPEETRGSAKKACCDSPHNSNSNSSCSCSTAERRRQRRAEAFYHSTAVQVILRAIEPKLDAVMADGYGNFLLQKVFDMAPDAERQRLLRLPSLQHHLCEVACSPHGTFAVQRLVETVRNTEEERLVFVALERDMLRLLTNANGGHVLMKVMECIRRQYAALTSNATTTNEASLPCLAASVGETGNGGGMATAAAAIGGSTTSPPLRTLLQERVDALFTTIQQNLLFVCQHKQGCCIVQKCLDFLNACSGLSPNTATASAATQPSARSRRGADEEESTKGSVPTQQQASVDYFDRMAALLLPHAHDLSVHPFGNYVVTRLVDVCYARGSTATIDAVAAVMQGDLVRMCTNKFASNVVEHILRHCSERRIRAVCQALMSRNNAPGMTMTMLNATASINPAVARLPLATVVMDPYGNYVVQTLLTVAPVDELASATSLDGGMLPVLQLLLPLLSARNFGRKLETKTELAVLRVEQYQQQQQQQQQQQCRRPK